MIGSWLQKWMVIAPALLLMQSGLYAQGGRGTAPAEAIAKSGRALPIPRASGLAS